MIQYHFDLYPRDDPRDGTRLVRFTKLQSAEYRGEANGTGAGRFSLRADTTDAGFIDPRGLQYVRVVREDTVAETEVVVGGFFLDSGDFTALDEKGTRLLTFGGAGVLSYLARAIIAEETYIAGAEGPFDDTWHWYYSTPGAILERMVTEAQEVTRPQNPIPDVTPTFTVLLDSDGNSWGSLWDHWLFEERVGGNLLALTERLMQHNLYVEMDPDTWDLNAWDADTHRRDRTGASWGTSVIRFQSPTAEDITTGNIKSDAKRAISAFIKRSDLLVGDKGIYTWVAGTSDIDWEGFYPTQDEDGTSHATVGAAQLSARSDAGDTLRLRIRLGTTPASGYYLPFEHILLDDLVTVHTGTGQWDFDEQTFPVAALTVSLRPGGDWDCWVDLGSSYSAAATRQFQVTPVPAHTHPPNPRLCEALSVTADTELLHFDWDTAPDYDETIPAYAGVSQPSIGWNGNLPAGGGTDGVGSSMPAADAGVYIVAPAAPGDEIAVTVKHRYAGSLLTPRTGMLAIEWVSGSYTGASTGWTTISREKIEFSMSASLQTATVSGVAPSGAVGFRLIDDDGTDPGDGLGYAGWHLHELWVSALGSASGSGIHPELVGTSNRAKRCDDTEHYHTDRAPTADDDETLGFRNGTMWINDDTGEMWLLRDKTAGAADYLKVGFGDHPIPSIEVAEADGSPDVSGVRRIEFDGGTLVDNADGSVTYTPPTGGSGIEVAETDGTPDVSGVTRIEFSSGTVVNDGGGQVTYTPPAAASHASSHEDGGADEVEIANLPTAETDTAKVLHPDGTGGLAWGGGGGTSDWDAVLTQASDQDVADVAVVVASTNLQFAYTAGVYEIDFSIVYSGNDATGDFRSQFNPSAGITRAQQLHGWISQFSGTGASQFLNLLGNVAGYWGNNQANVTGTLDQHMFMHGRLLFATDGTSGTMAFSFANFNAAAGRTVRLHAGSIVRYRKIV